VSERHPERAAASEAEREQLAAREAALGEREAELTARVSALTEREIDLARRVREVAEREKAVQGRAEGLALEAADLELRLEEVETAERDHVPSVAAPKPTDPLPVTVLPVGDPSPGRWNLLVLERLINDNGERFPDRLEEWASYLYFLRDYAEPDGSIPVSFDWLVQETFAELL
jgi:hypothetical protein